MLRHRKAHADRRGGNLQPLRLTAMLDVCFLLLVFFILTASFAVGEGILPAEMPVGPGPRATPTPDHNIPLILHLRDLGGDAVLIELAGQRAALADFAELHHALRRLQHRPDNPHGAFDATSPVILQPDATVPWGHTVNAFNAAVRAGYKDIRFHRRR